MELTTATIESARNDLEDKIFFQEATAERPYHIVNFDESLIALFDQVETRDINLNLPSYSVIILNPITTEGEYSISAENIYVLDAVSSRTKRVMLKAKDQLFVLESSLGTRVDLLKNCTIVKDPEEIEMISQYKSKICDALKKRNLVDLSRGIVSLGLLIFEDFSEGKGSSRVDDPIGSFESSPATGRSDFSDGEGSLIFEIEEL